MKHLTIVLSLLVVTVGCTGGDKKEACWPLCDGPTAPSPTPTTPTPTPPVVTYKPATLQIVLCPGGQGSLCNGGTVLVGGTTVNIQAGSYKAWAVITHHGQIGCTIDGAISISAWGSGAAGQITRAQEDKWPNPATVAIAINAVPGTAMVVADFQGTCPGQVTPLHQAATLVAR